MPADRKQPTQPRIWLTALQAAEYLGVDVKTIYRATRSGLRHARLSGRPGAELRIKREWLDAYLESRAQEVRG